MRPFREEVVERIKRRIQTIALMPQTDGPRERLAQPGTSGSSRSEATLESAVPTPTLRNQRQPTRGEVKTQNRGTTVRKTPENRHTHCLTSSLRNDRKGSHVYFIRDTPRASTSQNYAMGLAGAPYTGSSESSSILFLFEVNDS